jgi:hypothetical protein
MPILGGVKDVQNVDGIIAHAVNRQMTMAPIPSPDEEISQVGAIADDMSFLGIAPQGVDLLLKEFDVTRCVVQAVSFGIPIPDAIEIAQCRHGIDDLQRALSF